MDDDDYEYEDEQDDDDYEDDDDYDDEVDDSYDDEDESDDSDDEDDSDEEDEIEDNETTNEDEDSAAANEEGKKSKGKKSNETSARISGGILGGVVGGVPAIVLILLFVVIIAAVGWLASVVPSLFGEDAGTDPNAGISGGIQGDKFYGLRTIYKDDEQAKRKLIEEYSNTIIEIASGLNDNADLNITVKLIDSGKLPNEVDNFEYLNFSTTYADTPLFDMANDLASLVYAEDFSVDFNTADGVAFNKKVEDIKYFGVAQSLNAELAERIANYIYSNHLMSLKEATSTGEANELPSEATLSSAVSSIVEAMDHTRAEKLFVEDIIFNSKDDVATTGKKNYVAMIFMPKTNVTFTGFSFIVDNFDNFEKLSLSLLNDPSAKLTKSEFMQAYQFSYSGNISASAFEDIDTSNLSALSGGVSAYDILHGTFNRELYLTAAPESDSGNTVYTFKMSGVGVQFNFDGVNNLTSFLAGQFIVNYN